MKNILRQQVWKQTLSVPKDDPAGNKVITCRFDLYSGNFKGGPDIMFSELTCFSETKRYFNYSTNQNQGWQFLYCREIPHKKTKHNEPFKGFLKKSYSLGQNSPKSNNCDAFL